MPILTSFNEGHEIDFNVEYHTYHHGKTQLFSASSFVKYYEEEFDSVKQSYYMSEKTGLQQQTILNMWSHNGQVAAGFGTAIHNVLEYYDTHKATGAKVAAAKGIEENAALPNHPFLRQLILELETIRNDGECYAEVLISNLDRKICGQVDNLLVTGPKTCRIRDYKITVDINKNKDKFKAPFDYLPPTKLSKNFIQLAFYSYMMMQSGWKVEGVDIFNWNGTWRRYTCEGTDLAQIIIGVSGQYA